MLESSQIAVVMFEKRRLIIATKHRKESVIAPIVERDLGVVALVDPDFDTDELGTFTGEVERVLDPVSAAREKCLRAMKANDCDLGIASEGSFGPHPTMFFVNADDEILIFIDLKNNLEIVVRELSAETNFNAAMVSTKHEVMEFAKDSRFPEHGLILRESRESDRDIYKGITDVETLERVFEELGAKYKRVYAETDMRAMYNPMRMKVIASATEKLVQKITSLCPSCAAPGFGLTDVKKGLPCGLCNTPTNSVKSYVYQCSHCGYSKEEMYPNDIRFENPMYCDSCNP